MRGLKDIESAKLFTDGWLLYYNFLRPHESLKDFTPAKEAGIRYPYRNWQHIVAKKPIMTVSQTSSTSLLRVPEYQEGTPNKRQKSLVKRRKSSTKRKRREAPTSQLVKLRVT